MTFYPQEKMAWDFCSPYLHPRIYCDKVSVDGHEITNLISDDYFVKIKGFLAERFIKPPVMITIAFPCNIDIQKIIINPVVGSQKSCGFEIMTRSDVVKDSWIVNDRVPMEKDPHAQGTYVSVCRCLREYSTPSVFVFTNRSYRQKSNMSEHSSHNEDSAGTNVINSELRHFRTISLSSVSHVLIRITRTQGCCIPCVKSISVLGQPSQSVHKTILDKFWCLHNQFLQGQQPKEETPAIHKTKKELASKESGSANEEDEIPKDFMDPITCDIMTIPLLLPSGHSIDKYTLERHVAEEEKWGRTPNDPFTGVSFHGLSKPIPNGSLKVRIDQFLVKSGRKFKNVARTVGQSHDLLNRNVILNSVYKDATKSSKESSDSDCEIIDLPPKVVSSVYNSATSQVKKCSAQNKLKRISTVVCDFSPGEKKRKIDPGAVVAIPTVVKPYSKGQHPNINSPVTACHRLPFTTTTSSKTKGYTHTIHERNLSNSLDSAVSSTLGSLPSFRTNVTTNKTTDKTLSTPMCILCNLDLKSSKSGTYLLPCSHYLCRQCLLSETKLSTEVICKGCLSTWESKDVKKTYV